MTHPTEGNGSTSPDPTLTPHPTEGGEATCIDSTHSSEQDEATSIDPNQMLHPTEEGKASASPDPHPTEDGAIQGNAPTPNSLSHVIEGIIDSERELNSIEEEVREGDNTTNRSEIPDDLYFRAQRAGDRLVSNASSLVKNSTSNLAECFMGIRCKFDGGKVLNRIQRGSFQHRCNGAGLRFQLGPDWTSRVWHSVTGQEPGEVMRAYCAKSTLDHQKDMKTQ